jgi:hypothetical protein
MSSPCTVHFLECGYHMGFRIETLNCLNFYIPQRNTRVDRTLQHLDSWNDEAASSPRELTGSITSDLRGSGNSGKAQGLMPTAMSHHTDTSERTSWAQVHLWVAAKQLPYWTSRFIKERTPGRRPGWRPFVHSDGIFPGIHPEWADDWDPRFPAWGWSTERRVTSVHLKDNTLLCWFRTEMTMRTWNKIVTKRPGNLSLHGILGRNTQKIKDSKCRNTHVFLFPHLTVLHCHQTLLNWLSPHPHETGLPTFMISKRQRITIQFFFLFCL